MIFIERDQLTIIKLNDNTDTVSFHILVEKLLDKPSNVIYCEREGRLCGIISTGDIIRASEKGADCIAVNCNFTWVLGGEYMKARSLFHEKRMTALGEIPVLDADHRLIGNYLRWDVDLLFEIEFGKMDGGLLQQYYNKMILVRPSSVSKEKQQVFESFKNYLHLQGIAFVCIERSRVADYFDQAEEIWFVDHSERRAISALYVHLLHKNLGKTKFRSYIDFFCTGINRVITRDCLKNISKKGVHLLNLVVDFDTKGNDYYKMLMKEMESRFLAVGETISPVLPVAMYQEFFDDLCEDEYVSAVTKINFSVETGSGCAKLKDFKSKYYNVTDGERRTCDQPEKYDQTIYFVGPCFVWGHYVADKYTIESFLQKQLNETGYRIRVVNYGSPSQVDNFTGNDNLLLAANIESLPLRKDDIVIYACPSLVDKVKGCLKLDLAEVCKTYHAPAKWMIDYPAHCNHHIYSMFADAIYETIKPCLMKSVNERGQLLKSAGDFIKTIYIDRYFKDFDPAKYSKIGAIIMNCNPFTYGHRYLIDQALNVVDFLIIFAVEEDESLFSFEERFSMISDGVADLDNVMIVPSGPFILSKTTFPEYFIKEADEDIIENVENDITLFAERIAPCLNICYRFVGEEPEDAVTNEYNCAMKKILPEHGISLVEIPRKEQGGNYISASLTRRYLEERNMEKLKSLVPESTRKILFRGKERSMSLG